MALRTMAARRQPQQVGQIPTKRGSALLPGALLPSHTFCTTLSRVHGYLFVTHVCAFTCVSMLENVRSERVKMAMSTLQAARDIINNNITLGDRTLACCYYYMTMTKGAYINQYSVCCVSVFLLQPTDRDASAFG